MAHPLHSSMAAPCAPHPTHSAKPTLLSHARPALHAPLTHLSWTLQDIEAVWESILKVGPVTSLEDCLEDCFPWAVHCLGMRAGVQCPTPSSLASALCSFWTTHTGLLAMPARAPGTISTCWVSQRGDALQLL